MATKSQTNGEKGQEPRKPGRPPVPKGETLNVIIRPDLKRMLLSFKGEYGTEKAIVESILDAFSEFTPEQQRAVLLNPKVFSSFAALLAQNDWSAHTFTLEHWSWAVQCYGSLAEQYKNHTAYSTFALYRQGYAWMGFALELRAKALEQVSNRARWRELFEAAIDAVKRGILANGQATSQDFPTPFVLYNSACGYSLCAQFTIEMALHENGRWAKALRDKCEAKDPVRGKTEPKDPWDDIGSHWREESRGGEGLFRTGVDSESVEANGELAIQALKSITALPTGANAPPGVGLLPWPDPAFFRLRSKQDPDITFLTHDQKFASKFNDWRQEGKKQAEDEVQWYLRTYRELIRSH